MIPLEQGSVFRRLYCLVTSGDLGLSQSLWNRAVSSDTTEVSCTALDKSQSLWNRAVSSDKDGSCRGIESVSVSIPLEQGSVFRLLVVGKKSLKLSQSLWNRAVSSD